SGVDNHPTARSRKRNLRGGGQVMRQRPLRRGRALLIGAATTMATALVAGVAGPAVAQDGPQTSGWESLGDVTLRISGEGASRVTVGALAPQFMEQYPHIPIESG